MGSKPSRGAPWPCDSTAKHHHRVDCPYSRNNQGNTHLGAPHARRLLALARTARIVIIVRGRSSLALLGRLLAAGRGAGGARIAVVGCVVLGLDLGLLGLRVAELLRTENKTRNETRSTKLLPSRINQTPTYRVVLGIVLVARCSAHPSSLSQQADWLRKQNNRCRTRVHPYRHATFFLPEASNSSSLAASSSVTILRPAQDQHTQESSNRAEFAEQARTSKQQQRK